jgi:hypothetical protein
MVKIWKRVLLFFLLFIFVSFISSEIFMRIPIDIVSEICIYFSLCGIITLLSFWKNENDK